jgi:DNA (cytosine-5)-methyltransferase 1
MTAYYNEIDPYAAQWLRNLIKAGHIADGEVDERSITEVRAGDLRSYEQCHFFAGIGVWSRALRISGWSDERPVWTGSCPCQPFSAAGKGQGYADERHLWPHWYRLISECRPAVVFGEQVAAAIRAGWLDDVCLSLESLGYAVGAVNFPACSVGAFHIRQRLYWVADADGRHPSAEREQRGREQRLLAESDATGIVADAECDGGRTDEPGRRSEGRAIDRGPAFWSDVEWLTCSDGKARPTQSLVQPLADGIADSLGFMRSGEGWTLSPLAVGQTNRVGRLRAYGNAIVPQQAAEFIHAYLSI